MYAPVCLVLWLLARPAGAAAPCPGGRFRLHELPFVDVVIADSEVSVAGVCPPVPGAIKVSKRGTRVRARWNGCRPLTGPAALAMTVEAPGCAEARGVFKSRITLCEGKRCDMHRLRQPFTAARSE